MTGPAEWDQDSAPPVNQVLPAWDFITGAYCAFALMAALHHRSATGEGSEVRVPLGDVAMGTVANSGAMAEMLYRGGDRPRLGNAIWGALGRDFVSRDGQRFMVAVLTPNQWNAMVGALQIAEPIAALEADTGVQFARSDHNRFVHREALFAIVQEAAKQLDYAELAERLTRAGATFERYRTMFEAANDPVLVANNPLFGPSPANPSGFAYPAARSFAHLGGQAAGDPEPAPYLGEHSEEVLSERLGLSTAAIGGLIARGVVAPSDQHGFRRKQ
jgi:2-methylfumaryl-CoA isomerase